MVLHSPFSKKIKYLSEMMEKSLKICTYRIKQCFVVKKSSPYYRYYNFN